MTRRPVPVGDIASLALAVAIFAVLAYFLMLGYSGGY